MNPRPRLLLATTVALALAATAATLFATPRIAEAGAPSRPADAPLREAPALAPLAQVHALFLARRYAEAYGRYADLADDGDPAAASMALAMVMHGPALFGSTWSLTHGQLERWRALARQFALERELSLAAQESNE